jgi:hypothetical protein
MTMLRAFIVASLLGALMLGACGGAGSGGPQAPNLGTNNPASPKPSDPYSEPGY